MSEKRKFNRANQIRKRNLLIFVLVLFLPVVFLYLAEWAYGISSTQNVIFPVFRIVHSPLIACLSGIAAITACIGLFFLLKTSRKYLRWVFVIIFVPSICFWGFVVLLNGFVSNQLIKVEQLRVGTRLFKLAITEDFDWEISDVIYSLYDCDMNGIFCVNVYRSRVGIGTSGDPLHDANLRYDSELDVFLIENRGNIVYTINNVTGRSIDQKPLPDVIPITNDNVPTISEILMYPHGYLSTVAWSPGGEILAVGEDRFSASSYIEPIGVQLHNINDFFQPELVEVQQATRWQVAIDSIDFSPDGRYLSHGSADWTVRVLDITTRTEVASFDEPGDIIVLDFDSSSNYLAYGSWHEVWIKNIPEMTDAYYLRNDQGIIGDLSFSPDGEHLAVANGNLELWTLSENPTGEIPITDSVRVLAYSPDGSLIATGGRWDTLFSVYDTVNDDIILWENVDSPITDMVFDSTGDLLITGNRDGEIIIWDTDNWNQLVILNGHNGAVVSVDINPQNSLIASASRDGTVRLWGIIDN